MFKYKVPLVRFGDTNKVLRSCELKILPEVINKLSVCNIKIVFRKYTSPNAKSIFEAVLFDAVN